MTKLTDREKKMLLILCVVLALTLSLKYVIVPSLESIRSAKTQLKDLELLKKEIDTTVDAFNDIDNKLKSEYDYMNSNDYFYENIDDVFVDNLMQDFAQAYNLKITSLSFGLQNDDFTPDSFNDITNALLNIISQKTKLENAFMLTDNNIAAPSTVDYNTTTDITTPTFYCNIHIQGNVDDVMNMINHINESNKSIVLTGVNGEISEGFLTGNVSVEIYYII